VEETVRKLTEGQDSRLPKVMVYADEIVIWELNKSYLEKKFKG
jgi:hypothetical protein